MRFPQAQHQLIAKQQGLSIVELMVSMVIGLVIMAGVMKLFTSTRISYDTNDALMRIQENGQFAILRITRDLRNAGYWGCLGQQSAVNNLLDPSGKGYTAASFGFEHGVNGQFNMASAPYVTGTDTIQINSAAEGGTEFAVLTPYGPTTNDPIRINTANGIQQEEVLLVTNCIDADIFQVTNTDASKTGLLRHAVGTGNPGNLNNQLSVVYQDGSQVYRLRSAEYSIRQGSNGNPALFRSSAGVSEELVPDIETMKVLFGEDTDSDGSANRYVNAALVTDMKQVVALRVALVSRSNENNLTLEPQSYRLLGATITPNDRRLRRVYTATINLRNQSE